MSPLKKVLFVILIFLLYTIPAIVNVFLFEHPQTAKTEKLMDNIIWNLLPIVAFFASVTLLYKSKLSSNLMNRISIATSMIPITSILLSSDLYIQKGSLDIMILLVPLIAFLVPGRSGWYEFLNAQDIKRGIKAPKTYSKYQFRKKRK